MKTDSPPSRCAKLELIANVRKSSILGFCALPGPEQNKVWFWSTCRSVSVVNKAMKFPSAPKLGTTLKNSMEPSAKATLVGGG